MHQVDKVYVFTSGVTLFLFISHMRSPKIVRNFWQEKEPIMLKRSKIWQILKSWLFLNVKNLFCRKFLAHWDSWSHQPVFLLIPLGCRTRPQTAFEWGQLKRRWFLPSSPPLRSKQTTSKFLPEEACLSSICR